MAGGRDPGAEARRRAELEARRAEEESRRLAEREDLEREQRAAEARRRSAEEERRKAHEEAQSLSDEQAEQSPLQASLTTARMCWVRTFPRSKMSKLRATSDARKPTRKALSWGKKVGRAG